MYLEYRIRIKAILASTIWLSFKAQRGSLSGKADKLTKLQRRRLTKLSRPQGSQKMKSFCVIPPRRSKLATPRRQALKSFHFLASKAGFNSHPVPQKSRSRNRKIN